jgi:hypothetical protein
MSYPRYKVGAFYRHFYLEASGNSSESYDSQVTSPTRLGKGLYPGWYLLSYVLKK